MNVSVVMVYVDIRDVPKYKYIHFLDTDADTGFALPT